MKNEERRQKLQDTIKRYEAMRPRAQATGITLDSYIYKHPMAAVVIIQRILFTAALVCAMAGSALKSTNRQFTVGLASVALVCFSIWTILEIEVCVKTARFSFLMLAGVSFLTSAFTPNLSASQKMEGGIACLLCLVTWAILLIKPKRDCQIYLIASHKTQLRLEREITETMAKIEQAEQGQRDLKLYAPKFEQLRPIIEQELHRVYKPNIFGDTVFISRRGVKQPRYDEDFEPYHINGEGYVRLLCLVMEGHCTQSNDSLADFIQFAEGYLKL